MGRLPAQRVAPSSVPLSRTGQPRWTPSEAISVPSLAGRRWGGATWTGDKPSGDVLFDFNSAEIRGPGAAEMAKVAHVIRERATGEVVVVIPTRWATLTTTRSCRRSGRARSCSALNAKGGIPAQLLVGRGMGSKKPVVYKTMPDGSDNPEGRAKNWRVEIPSPWAAEVPDDGADRRFGCRASSSSARR